MDMMELMNLLGNKDMLDGISKNSGADSDKVGKLINMGLPTIMKAMNKNATSNDGAQSLLNALKQHENDDVEDMVKNPSKINRQDGEKILGHILSSKKDVVNNNLAKETGLGSDQVNKILSQLAPLLMGTLGQQQKNSNIDSNNVSNLLSDALGKSAKGGMMDLAEKFLDSDKDGSIVDDVGKL
ncbi:MAG: DUF937 domain-containing protein, partial [Clostridia bacterium]|nr:DUF937 domain-containing protein [Clostridia bacterium]